MACNKDEAIKAKNIALVKMQNKDFLGAREIVLKAERLCKDLNDLPQMLAVCDVHCAAEQKFGGEMDWYGILQIELTVDEATIKKQYKKYALLVHPDKNKFPGAEAAFKLTREAYCVLSDKSKRSSHDLKRKTSSNQPSKPPKTEFTQKRSDTSSFAAHSKPEFSQEKKQFNSQKEQKASSSSKFQDSPHGSNTKTEFPPKRPSSFGSTTHSKAEFTQKNSSDKSQVPPHRTNNSKTEFPPKRPSSSGSTTHSKAEFTQKNSSDKSQVPPHQTNNSKTEFPPKRPSSSGFTAYPKAEFTPKNSPNKSQVPPHQTNSKTEFPPQRPSSSGFTAHSKAEFTQKNSPDKSQVPPYWTNNSKTEFPPKKPSSSGFAAHSKSEFSQKKNEFNSQNVQSRKQERQEASSHYKSKAGMNSKRQEENMNDGHRHSEEAAKSGLPLILTHLVVGICCFFVGAIYAKKSESRKKQEASTHYEFMAGMNSERQEENMNDGHRHSEEAAKSESELNILKHLVVGICCFILGVIYAKKSRD